MPSESYWLKNEIKSKKGKFQGAAALLHTVP